MQRIAILSTVALLFLILVVQAEAVEEEAFLSGRPGDSFVETVVDAANELLPKGRMFDGTPPPPVTPAERRDGVIPFEAARLIVNLAADTALAEFCGLDWKQLSFRPIMRRERARGTWTDRQLAYIGLMHGFVQGQSHKLLQHHETCTGEMKESVAAFFAGKRW